MTVWKTIWSLALTAAAAGAIAKETPFRLTDNVSPIFQRISLDIDPNKPDFSGTTQIDVKVISTTGKIEFHQRGLRIDDAQLCNGKSCTKLHVSSHDYDIQHGVSNQPIQKGEYSLNIAFSGKIDTTSEGMYFAKYEERNYIFTQFQDMYARKAFPSFDEPNIKIPYQLTISAPQINRIVSNTPVLSSHTQKGMKTVTFEKTKPMPSYLIAYTVGELDFAEIKGLSVPGKIYTPKGQAHRTGFAARHTAPILAALESYFGTPYPYKKLDFVAVPNFTHGAMENVGLVTYSSEILLLEDKPTLSDQHFPLRVIAHELAHMWYGNLVTMAWWDDLWLNEAFASLMESKILMLLYPEQNAANELVQEFAYQEDALPTTKPIKKLVRSQSDAIDGLDLNYTKGQSILRWVESLIGEKTFQKGVRNYLKNHTWENAVASDLWSELDKASELDIVAVMRSYLEQPGYPLIKITSDGSFEQQRFLLTVTQEQSFKWTVPLTIKYKKKGKLQSTRLILNKIKMQFPQLSEADWVMPDENAMGYLRWTIPASQLNNLLSDLLMLNPRERKSLLHNSGALFNAGKISIVEHMKVIEALSTDSDPQIASAVVTAFEELTYLIDDTNSEIFSVYVESLLMRWFNELGYAPKPGEPTDINLLRSTLFKFISELGTNSEILDVSEKLTNQYLSNRSSVERDLAAPAMRATAMFGDGEFFDRYQQAFTSTLDDNVRYVIGSSMYFPQEKNLIKNLEFVLSEHITPAIAIHALAVASYSQENKDTFYAWLEDNMDKVTAKLPTYSLANFPEFLSDACDLYNLQLAKQFYKKHLTEHPKMQRSYEVMIGSTEQCIALKKQHQPGLTKFLQQQR